MLVSDSSAAVSSAGLWPPPAAAPGRRSYLRQTEVQNLRLAPRGHEDVRRLDVAVDDALGVRRVQPVGNLNAQVQHFLGLEQLAAAMRCFSVWPSRHSMAMKGWPSCSSIS